MSQLNDISLVAQVVVFRNTRAFDQLVKKYQSPVRRFFLNLTCGDNELSDDLAQDTFIKAYTNLASFKNLSNFSTWLYRIAYNVFYDYLRSRKETADLDTREVDTRWNTSQDDVGQQMDVYRALATLKEMERTCITLFYMEDQSIEKIAGITGCPAGTVKSHLSRAKEKMVMTETTDDKLLQQFFSDNRKEIEDNGFSRRVMHHLPNRYYRISQLWSLFCFTLAVVLFFVLDGLQLVLGALRETFTSAIQSGAAELDPKSLIIVAVVLVYLGYRKICSLA